MDPPKVLLVDDHEVYRIAWADAIRQVRPDAEIHEAPDGRAALKLYPSIVPVYLLCTDFQMPHMDGLELLRALEQEPIPYRFLMSGDPECEAAAAAEKAGAHFIAKDGAGLVRFALSQALREYPRCT